MGTNILQTADKNIIYKRKMGYSLKEIWSSRQSHEPSEDGMISLNHVVRVCHEEGLPFTLSQIKRVFDKMHVQKDNGSKISAWTFLKQWSGKKLLKFEMERSVPFQKVLSGPIESGKLSSPLHDNDKKVTILGSWQK